MEADGRAAATVIAAALRRERDRAGLSLSEVAQRAGIAKSTLSQLESGTGNPSVETLWALAVALDVPFSRLVEPPAPQVRVIRAGEGPAIHSEQADFTGTLLPPARRTPAATSTSSAGARPGRKADAHMPGSVEHVVARAGRLRVGPADAHRRPGPGRLRTFPGDVPHIYEALSPAPRFTLVMEHR